MKRFAVVLGILAVVLAVPGVGSHSQSTPTVDGWSIDNPDSRIPVSGNAFDDLGDGTPGEVSIVAQAAPNGEASDLPIILRNGTEQTVRVDVSAEARNSAGTLLDVADAFQTFPFYVEPGGLVLAPLSFSNAVPKDAEVSFTVDAVPDDLSATDWVGLELSEYNPDVGGGIGTLFNPNDSGVENLYLRMACFSDDGSLQSSEVVSSTRDRIPPGETSPFRILLLGTDTSCSTFLLFGFGEVSA